MYDVPYHFLHVSDRVKMVKISISSYYISVPKSNTAYYTTGNYKKQSVFLFFNGMFRIAVPVFAAAIFKYMSEIKMKNSGKGKEFIS